MRDECKESSMGERSVEFMLKTERLIIQPYSNSFLEAYYILLMSSIFAYGTFGIYRKLNISVLLEQISKTEIFLCRRRTKFDSKNFWH